MALGYLDNTKFSGELPSYLKGIRDALASSKENEEQRNISLINMMNATGLEIPTEILFQLGLPKKEFILKVNLLNGRLGDKLGTLSKLIHAQREINIILCIKSPLSKSNLVILYPEKDSFNSDLPQISYSESINKFITDVALNTNFNRKLLQESSRSIFSKIPSKNEYSELDVNDSVVVHVRGGDALFEGAIPLPPLNYYLKCIKRISPNKIIIVSEPDDLKKNGMNNPVPGLIKDYCNNVGIKYIHISTKDYIYDAGIIYWAKKVIASTSSFAQMLSIFSHDCHSLYIPTYEDISNEWMNDQCLEKVKCMDSLYNEEWAKDMNYRISWVTS